MDFDLILAGGGLASGLTALRLAQRQPKLRVATIESSGRIGGDHIWSSFDTDMSPEQRQWTAPLYARQWPRYSVHFPAYKREFANGYASARSALLDAAVRNVLPSERIITGEAKTIEANKVTLADGRSFEASVVIDGRGQSTTPALELAWQKFVGFEIETVRPHGLDAPIVMDATVDQIDGYRFVYVLPWDERRLLVEDTYFSSNSAVDDAALKLRIEAYAASAGWGAFNILRVERGVLPMALDGDITALLAESANGVSRIGMRAALFHPATGYSFPDAVRTADLIAGLHRFDPDYVHSVLTNHAEHTWYDRRYYRMLNRLLFRAAEPQQRYRVLQRFYGLPEPLVARFYGGMSSGGDKIRILAGKPPVSVLRAVSVLAGLR